MSDMAPFIEAEVDSVSEAVEAFWGDSTAREEGGGGFEVSSVTGRVEVSGGGFMGLGLSSTLAFLDDVVV